MHSTRVGHLSGLTLPFAVFFLALCSEAGSAEFISLALLALIQEKIGQVTGEVAFTFTVLCADCSIVRLRTIPRHAPKYVHKGAPNVSHLPAVDNRV